MNEHFSTINGNENRSSFHCLEAWGGCWQQDSETTNTSGGPRPFLPAVSRVSRTRGSMQLFLKSKVFMLEMKLNSAQTRDGLMCTEQRTTQGCLVPNRTKPESARMVTPTPGNHAMARAKFQSKLLAKAIGHRIRAMLCILQDSNLLKSK